MRISPILPLLFVVSVALTACAHNTDLIARLNDIDLHHGVYSATPPYTILEVVGTQLSERLKSEMKEYGFNDFRQTRDGFIATRPEPQNPK